MGNNYLVHKVDSNDELLECSNYYIALGYKWFKHQYCNIDVNFIPYLYVDEKNKLIDISGVYDPENIKEFTTWKVFSRRLKMRKM